MTEGDTAGRVKVSRVPSDEEVIASVRAGDSASYEVLVRRYERFLRYMTLRVLHDDADADDLIQEVHLKAFHHLDQFAGRSSFATWLATIAIHGAASHQRKDPHRLACGAFATVDTPERSLPSAALDPEQQVLGAEARRALRAASSRCLRPTGMWSSCAE